MADTTTKQVLSVVATTSDRVKDLVIKNSQLIFIQDLGRIAFDFKNKRKFYNQIEELDTEATRQELETPVNGCFYFVIDTAVLWTYRNNAWVQLTTPPSEILFVGVEFPALGQANKIYANTTSGNENISVWDEKLGCYVVVADKTQMISEEDIGLLFE